MTPASQLRCFTAAAWFITAAVAAIIFQHTLNTIIMIIVGVVLASSLVLITAPSALSALLMLYLATAGAAVIIPLPLPQSMSASSHLIFVLLFWSSLLILFQTLTLKALARFRPRQR